MREGTKYEWLDAHLWGEKTHKHRERWIVAAYAVKKGKENRSGKKGRGQSGSCQRMTAADVARATKRSSLELPTA